MNLSKKRVNIKMTLKNAQIGRAEDLPTSEQERLGIKSGLIIIQSINPDLRKEIKPISGGGIREFLIENWGDFQEDNQTL